MSGKRYINGLHTSSKELKGGTFFTSAHPLTLQQLREVMRRNNIDQYRYMAGHALMRENANQQQIDRVLNNPRTIIVQGDAGKYFSIGPPLGVERSARAERKILDILEEYGYEERNRMEEMD